MILTTLPPCSTQSHGSSVLRPQELIDADLLITLSTRDLAKEGLQVLWTRGISARDVT